MRRFSDFGGRDRHLGAVAVLLRAAVDGGENDDLLCSGQVLLLSTDFVVVVGPLWAASRSALWNAAAMPASCQLEHVRSTAGGTRPTRKLKVRHETAALRDFGPASDRFGGQIRSSDDVHRTTALTFVRWGNRPEVPGTDSCTAANDVLTNLLYQPPISGTFASVITFFHLAMSAFT